MSKTAVVFPGQGSQYVGMGKDLYDAQPAFQQIYDQADKVLGYSLTDIMFNGPEEDLKLTSNTQPALLTMSAALWELLKDRINPDFFAGHSLGEYSAHVAAGSISFEDAVLAVHNRGKFMQEAVPVGMGAMAAVMGAKDEDVVRVCDEINSPSTVCEPANFNSPGQIVVAGHKEAVEEFGVKIKEIGAKRVVMLPVSAPFHCSLMMPAQEKMAEYLQNITISEPAVPVCTNVDAALESDAKSLENALIRQVSSSVRWTESVQAMIDAGVETFYEVGAGKVLSGLIKKIDKKVKCVNISTLEDLDK